jgi:hypothetical protein
MNPLLAMAYFCDRRRGSGMGIQELTLVDSDEDRGTF